MTIWYTSDHHHFHKRITELTPRGKFTDADHHTEWLIDLWNMQVNKSDTVYHLGDFNFSTRTEDWAKILRRLNGQIILIKGNHDDDKVLKSIVTSGLIHSWHDYKETKIEGTKVVLMHYPIESWNRMQYGSFHLHGHSHGSLPDSGGKRLDVGLDSAYDIFGKHKFFSDNDVLEYMQGRPVVSADHHMDKTKE